MRAEPFDKLRTTLVEAGVGALRQAQGAEQRRPKLVLRPRPNVPLRLTPTLLGRRPQVLTDERRTANTATRLMMNALFGAAANGTTP
jgi:hypothetical protein